MGKARNLIINRMFQRKRSRIQRISIYSNYMRKISVTCNTARTMERSLKRSSQFFKEFPKKDNNKDLVIVRYGKAISLHYLCSLIKNNHLNIKNFKKHFKPKQQGCGSAYPRRKVPSDELVMFHVLTKGDKDGELLRNPALKTAVEVITVYVFKAETVKRACRFQNNMIMFNPVNNLGGKIYKIMRLKQSKPKIKIKVIIAPEKICEIYYSAMKESAYNLSPSHNLSWMEYGQIKQSKLMDFCNSVCLVRIDRHPGGSGFVLFGGFVLTNGHVIKGVYNNNTRQLDGKVTVHFSHKILNQLARGQEFGEVEVEEVVGFEFCLDVSGYMYDWALLKLKADQMLPDGLLKHFGFVPPSGRICIVGHPDGGVKKIDACSVIPPDDRNQVMKRNFQEQNQGHSQMITCHLFDSVVESLQYNKQLLTYKSSLYFGSSGSPVFDNQCKVVAMHSGGYTHSNARGEKNSIMEFGYRLSDIIVHIIVQLVETKRFDVLNAYLTCSYPHHQDIMSNVKKLVESRNLIAFKNEVNSSEATNLKTFFDFFSEKEEPIPMDIEVYKDLPSW